MKEKYPPIPVTIFLPLQLRTASPARHDCDLLADLMALREPRGP